MQYFILYAKVDKWRRVIGLSLKHLMVNLNNSNIPAGKYSEIINGSETETEKYTLGTSKDTS